ncbi:MAG: dTMP kinase [Pseudothermotoga sp.]|uniref:dTMP kinase n=1 Tax=Pseudothermotoga sp. TaxID=2033661 RepID=UPI000E8DDFF2|nr:dTMP kinase [Pseudothermotoga sp.]HBT40207.1 dTMP kinase [Pseudothermotoga sp.]HCO98660.1 dTMP kinase [Pseudothermotoga sp.]
MVKVFISFEGIDGSGKGTQVQLFLDYLKRNGVDFVYVREPGGTPVGELIRSVLLSSQNMIPKAELFLFLSSRAQLVETVIKPALAQNKTVVADRFADSSVAYQGFARGLGVETVKWLNDFATGGLKPDLTFYIDVPVEVALSRKKRLDRIESEGEEFLNKVRQGYLELLKDEPERFVFVDGNASELSVHRFIIEEFEKRRRK